jgi:hypothetical protein
LRDRRPNYGVLAGSVEDGVHVADREGAKVLAVLGELGIEGVDLRPGEPL